MSTRTQRQITRSNKDALAAFVQKKTEIDTMLARLQALSDEHFGYGPDDVTWSHVGSLEHYAELLKRITDSAFQEGDQPGNPPPISTHAPRGPGRRGFGS